MQLIRGGNGMSRRYKMWIGGKWIDSDEELTVQNPYDGETVALAPYAGEADLENAISAACEAFPKIRAMASYQRAEILMRLRDGVRRRHEDFAQTISLEAGKPILDARVEVDRAINVLTLAEEEAKRIGGEVMPLDMNSLSISRLGIVRRFPVGPIIGITPYNFPLNLGMHKVAPALAMGCSVVWKPSPLAPGAALLFAELAENAGIPKGALNILVPTNDIAEQLVTDPRPRMLSFTGSAQVGWRLRSLAGNKKVMLELGGNAAVVIDSDADLDFAIQRCVSGGFVYAGQTCISVQRIFVAETIYDRFLSGFIPLVRNLRMGNPLDEATQVGPIISDREAERLERWINEAVDNGAEILTGGDRKGRMVEPSVLTNVPPSMKVSCEEVFGPVVTVSPYKTWDEALAKVNDSHYGLQAGVFTNDIRKAFLAFEGLETGGVILNDAPTYRMDGMPYGGVKSSGLGREGVRYAMEEMSDLRIFAMNLA